MRISGALHYQWHYFSNGLMMKKIAVFCSASFNIDKKYNKFYFTNGNQKSQDFNLPANGGTYTYNHGWS